MEILLNGGNEKFSVNSKAMGVTRSYEIDFEGIASFIEHQYKNSDSNSIKRWAKGFMDDVPCSSCHGGRLKKESLHFKINGKNISELARLDISELASWFVDIEKRLSKKQLIIATEILKEIRNSQHGVWLQVASGYNRGDCNQTPLVTRRRDKRQCCKYLPASRIEAAFNKPNILT